MGDRDPGAAADGGVPPYGGAFGLSREPFEARPDVDFFCTTRANRHVRKFLQTAIAELTPVTLLTGPRGSGKTAIVQRLQRAVTEGLQMGVLEPGQEGGDLFERLLAAFGQDAPAEGPSAARDAFLRFCVSGFEEGRASLLVVDDAGTATVEDLATLRHLISVRPGMTCPLILLLVGRPEVDERLRAAELDERVGASISLPPMGQEDTAGYVRHRMTVAGGSTRTFDQGALEIVHRRSGGLPGQVNALCDVCLDAAARSNVGRVDATLAAAVPDEDMPIPEAPSPAAEPTGRTRPAPGPEPRAVEPRPAPVEAVTPVDVEPISVAPAPDEPEADEAGSNESRSVRQERDKPRSDGAEAGEPESVAVEPERVAVPSSPSVLPPPASQDGPPPAPEGERAAPPVAEPPEVDGETRPAGTSTRADDHPVVENPVVESLRTIPSYLVAVVTGGRDGSILDRRRGAERAEPALTLALSCMTGSAATLMASTSDAVCLVDTSRGIAVAGGRGLNLGFVRRAIRDLPARTPETSWTPDRPVVFAEPWRTALWRMAQVIDRTASPRRITLDGASVPPLLLADGRVELSHRDGLGRLGPSLREAADRSQGSLRYALAPAVEGPAVSAGAVEALVAAAGVELVEARDVTLDAQGWPLAMPRGVSFPALALAVGIGRRLAASGKGSHVSALQGAFQHRVASRSPGGRVEVDAGWLAAQVGEVPWAADPARASGDAPHPGVPEMADGVG